MKFISNSLSDIMTELKTDFTQGLTDSQVAASRSLSGENRFKEPKKDGVFKKIFGHMRDFTTIILLAAGCIALYSALSGGDKGPIDAIVIFSIVIINIFLAVKQEMGAEKSLEALKKMTVPSAIVVRNGVQQNIDACQLVPGDIVILATGDSIPADCRLIETSTLQVDESMLTGESVPSEKDHKAIVAEDAPIGDRYNMVFSGCLVTKGRGKAVVVLTGMNTEMGKIAEMLEDTLKVRTPLQRKMDKLCKWICLLAIVSGGALFMLQTFANVDLAYRLMSAVSVSVAAIPEGLPIIMTLVLVFGVKAMSHRNVIVRKMPAVEALGSVHVICSDKTGTLTQNKMTVQRLWAVGNDVVKSCHSMNDDENKLIKYMALCNNASVSSEGNEIGDPTELGLIRLAYQHGYIKDELADGYARVAEIPFDSERKCMTTVHKLFDGTYVSITKGAFDFLDFCKDSVNWNEVDFHVTDWGNRALRVLAVGFKRHETLPEAITPEVMERNLTFLGLMGMIDPPRPESIEAVRIAKEASIKVVMITGDHKDTARAIAEEIGIWQEGDRVVTGAELDAMTQQELERDIADISVFARVSPENKIRVVQAWQSKNTHVSMTGDGVNDAISLKGADVGVAMGITGTEVSKQAADIILTDDNFNSIVAGVEEGRRIYDNVRKVINSLLPANISEVLAMIIGFILWSTTPFSALQLLFINCVADTLPDIQMAREQAEPGLMRRKPIRKGASVFAQGMWLRIGIMGAWFTVATLIMYWIGSNIKFGNLPPSHDIARTLAYTSLAFGSVINIVNARTFEVSIFKVGLLSNPHLFAMACLSFFLVILTATVPGLQGIFSTVPITGYHWGLVVAISLVPFIIMEGIKVFVRRNSEIY